jgi:hypothetical protein
MQVEQWEQRSFRQSKRYLRLIIASDTNSLQVPACLGVHLTSFVKVKLGQALHGALALKRERARLAPFVEADGRFASLIRPKGASPR